MPLAVAETLFDPLAAELARGRLEAAGIPAVLFDGGIALLIGSGLGGVRLMVDDGDLAAARALLADLAAPDRA